MRWRCKVPLRARNSSAYSTRNITTGLSVPRDAATKTGGYLNCPLNFEEYTAFREAVLAAELVPLKEFEPIKMFEGCLPIEELARRGDELSAPRAHAAGHDLRADRRILWSGLLVGAIAPCGRQC